MLWSDLPFLSGLVVVLLLLVSLLAVRLTAVAGRSGLTPAMLGGGGRISSEECEAPEVSPEAWDDSTDRFPTPSPDLLDEYRSSLEETADIPHPVDRSSPTMALAHSLEKSQPLEAAKIWGVLGRWDRAAMLHEDHGSPAHAAHIWLALGKPDAAAALLQKALRNDPAAEPIRLGLVVTFFNTNRLSEARELIRAVTTPDSPVVASTHFLEQVGRAYETVSDRQGAVEFYRLAVARGDAPPELEQRLVYLKHTERLAQPYPSENENTAPKEFLDRALRESSISQIPSDLLGEHHGGNAGATPAGKPDNDTARDLRDHEIIVGHLAFGFSKVEPFNRAGSVFSLSRRFAIQRILKEHEFGATFEATDRLLDYPVALKLHRLPADTPGFGVLRARLRAIAQLNHPNLAKVTFVDREGPMLRLATEFLPGGNLGEYLARMGGAGVPLLIRMSMYLASALYSAHLRGVPHGDIRPENILIGTDQRLKLIDFALSPIPVQHIDLDTSLGESSETPQLLESMAKSEGIQSDITQFGEIIAFMLKHVRPTSNPLVPDGPDPEAEMSELATRLQKGEFTSVLRLWQVLEQIFQRAVPPKTSRSQDKSPRS